MDILLGLATTVHLGVVGEYSQVHPHARLEATSFVAGAYYNSEENISFYAGYRFDSDFTFLEVGAVSGYAAVAPLLPFARAGLQRDGVRLFVAPAGEVVDGQLNLVLVAGLEYMFRLNR